MPRRCEKWYLGGEVRDAVVVVVVVVAVARVVAQQQQRHVLVRLSTEMDVCADLVHASLRCRAEKHGKHGKEMRLHGVWSEGEMANSASV